MLALAEVVGRAGVLLGGADGRAGQVLAELARGQVVVGNMRKASTTALIRSNAKLDSAS
ncbi:hypothetical protein WEH80_40210 [Actinomycetes bacterium KLBMP 9759]